MIGLANSVLFRKSCLGYVRVWKGEGFEGEEVGSDLKIVRQEGHRVVKYLNVSRKKQSHWLAYMLSKYLRKR